MPAALLAARQVLIRVSHLGKAGQAECIRGIRRDGYRTSLPSEASKIRVPQEGQRSITRHINVQTGVLPRSRSTGYFLTRDIVHKLSYCESRETAVAKRPHRTPCPRPYTHDSKIPMQLDGGQRVMATGANPRYHAGSNQRSRSQASFERRHSSCLRCGSSHESRRSIAGLLNSAAVRDATRPNNSTNSAAERRSPQCRFP